MVAASDHYRCDTGAEDMKTTVLQSVTLHRSNSRQVLDALGQFRLRHNGISSDFAIAPDVQRVAEPTRGAFRSNPVSSLI